jgi:hypothetical protein
MISKLTPVSAAVTPSRAEPFDRRVIVVGGVVFAVLMAVSGRYGWPSCPGPSTTTAGAPPTCGSSSPASGPWPRCPTRTASATRSSAATSTCAPGRAIPGARCGRSCAATADHGRAAGLGAVRRRVTARAAPPTGITAAAASICGAPVSDASSARPARSVIFCNQGRCSGRGGDAEILWRRGRAVAVARPPRAGST